MQGITNTNPTRMTRIAPQLVIVVGVCVYAGSLDGPFIFDDISAITDNPNVGSLSPLWKAMWAPPYTAASGRPLVSLSLAINHALAGLNVRGFHLFKFWYPSPSG